MTQFSDNESARISIITWVIILIIIITIFWIYWGWISIGTLSCFFFLIFLNLDCTSNKFNKVKVIFLSLWPQNIELYWNLCVICQRKTSEALKCPLENPVKKRNKKDGYTNFLNHVKQFQGIDSLPVIAKFGCDETAENWKFQSCEKFSSCKLERAKLKRKRSSDSIETRDYQGKRVNPPYRSSN